MMISGTRKQILIVEDEENLRKLLALRLERTGFTVHGEGTGAGGLRYAAEGHPDLIILDVRLPDLTGYEICAVLRKLFHSSRIPIVMLTGLDQPVDQLRGFAHGADAYVTKPFDFAELQKTIEFLLSEAIVE